MFEYRTIGGVGVYVLPALEKTGLVAHCFTGREGGVSPAPYDTLNMGLRRDDKREYILENYRRVCRAMGFNYYYLTVVNYVHGNNVAVAKAEDAGRGFLRQELDECDGIVTNVRGLPIVTLHADCVPVFFLDPKKRAIGLCHAGWRGVLSGVAVNTLRALEREYGTNASDCIVGIAPSLGPCCFEISEPETSAFRNAFGEGVMGKSAGGKDTADLFACIETQLAEAGVLRENIWNSRICTSCERERLYSARAEGTTGAMAAIMMLV